MDWFFFFKWDIQVVLNISENMKYIYKIVIQNFVRLGYDSGYMFWAEGRVIFRLIFEQVECTTDNAANLQDLVLWKLVKIVICCIKKLMI